MQRKCNKKNRLGYSTDQCFAFYGVACLPSMSWLAQFAFSILLVAPLLACCYAKGCNTECQYCASASPGYVV